MLEDVFRDEQFGNAKPHFVRSIGILQGTPASGLHFRVAADKLIEARGENVFAVCKGLHVKLPAPGLVRDAGGHKELLLPAGADTKLEYHLVP